MEGGVSEYPSLPTVLSGNVSNAAASVNEVKRMDRCPCSSPPHLSGPIQNPHPYCSGSAAPFRGKGPCSVLSIPLPGGGALQKTKTQRIVFLLPTSHPSNSSFPSLGVFAALGPAGSK